MDVRERVERYLGALTAFPDRHVGGPGNRAATALFTERMAELGCLVSRRDFDCIEWEYGEAAVEAGGERFALHVGPYSLALDATARLMAATRVEGLETEAVRGAAVLIHGDLAQGQIMPKNFTFYNPESHQRLVRALEEHAPAAVFAATGRDPEMVGSQYPFPLFEDGDLDVPNAYLKDVDGERLLEYVGDGVRVQIDSRRIPTTAEHVIATLPGTGVGRIVISAHIDSRKDSPGALDNASGVTVLMVLAELLAGYAGDPSIEFVPFNGEDNYANPGEMLWYADNRDRHDDIVTGINIDDLGMRNTTNHLSFYGCPREIEGAVLDVAARHPSVSQGPQWFQGDHAILAQMGVPAIAMTSSDMAGFMANYAHSERDTTQIADSALMADAARFLNEAVRAVAGLATGVHPG
jgi:aminopeptidase YwaD